VHCGAFGDPESFSLLHQLPEGIRLTVMMYIRYPPSLRQVEDLLFERGLRCLPRNGVVLVEPVWPDVRCGDPQAAGLPSIILEQALAPGRGVRESQWRDTLSLARDHEDEVLEDHRAALTFLKVPGFSPSDQVH